MALCHDERDFAMGFTREDHRSEVLEMKRLPSKKFALSAYASGVEAKSYQHTVRNEVVRVLFERGPQHLEDLGQNYGHKHGVCSEWVSTGEIKAALQYLRKLGAVQTTRDLPYRYWNWSLVLPHPGIKIRQ